MDTATMRAQLSDPRLPFQRPAMEWAREHPAEATPVLLSMIAICAKPGNLTEREANGAFFALPLLAELQETRAFPTLCALARNGDRLDEIFGDFGAENLHRLIVALCADDLTDVRAVAKDGGVEPSIRASFLQAWTVLVLRSGAHAAAFDDFAAFGKTLVGADAGILPYDLANALIVADPFRAMPLIQDAYARGDLDPSFTDISDYTQEASTWRDDPAGMRDTFLLENGPIANVIGFMDQWFEQVEARIASGRDGAGSGDDEQDFSQAANPYREVGRNDPCPCGSGKKFKKCCLPTLDEPAIPRT